LDNNSNQRLIISLGVLPYVCFACRSQKGYKFILQSSLDIICKVCYAINAQQAIQEGDDLKTIIPELRKKHKLSQEELALAVGVTRQTITSIEIGKYTASLTLAYKIANYFGKSIEEVFDFSNVEVNRNE